MLFRGPAILGGPVPRSTFRGDALQGAWRLDDAFYITGALDCATDSANAVCEGCLPMIRTMSTEPGMRILPYTPRTTQTQLRVLCWRWWEPQDGARGDAQWNLSRI